MTMRYNAAERCGPRSGMLWTVNAAERCDLFVKTSPVIFTEASRHAPPAGSNQLGNYQSTVVSCSSARVMVSFENLPE